MDKYLVMNEELKRLHQQYAYLCQEETGSMTNSTKRIEILTRIDVIHDALVAEDKLTESKHQG